ncbi:MAG TPA: hypothetical protein VLT33_06700 [Labilithrix sp.]|nr:hypothetical protein [Labilithrix sp.]
MKRWHWIALAALLPTVLIFWGNACFIWNHFLEGPYLQDSGWGSALVFHNDFFPKDPPSADWRPEYFGIHASLALSFASMLSYLFPGDRVDWYCLFQGAIYAPLGAVVALLVGRDDKRTNVRDALMVGGCALAFALNGQVIACMGYPHYEILGPVGVCTLLAGLAGGRTRLAWAGLAIAICAREDGGFHAASFLAAVLACDWLKRPFPVKRRLVLTMVAVAVASSVLLIAMQKLFFQHANYLAAVAEGGDSVKGLDLFRHEYLGVPTYAHLSGAVLAQRARAFVEQAGFLLLPMLATAVIAVVRRDARYLLGWVVELPWLLLNFLALQELKSRFAIYTGFPFVVSIFWVGVYAFVRGEGRRRTLGFLASVSLVSTLGSYTSASDAFVSLARRIAYPLPIPSAGIRSFSRTLRANPDAYGPIFVDHGVAAWTLEKLPIDARLHGNGFIRAHEPLTPAMLAQRDGIAFYKDGFLAPIILRLVTDGGFSSCGRIAGTGVFFCTKEGRPLPPEMTPSSLLVGRLRTQGSARREGETIVVEATEQTGIQAFGATLQMASGLYTARWSTKTRDCRPNASPRMRFDVALGGKEAYAKEVLLEGDTADLDFVVDDPGQSFELRAWSGGSTYVIDAITVLRR